MNSHSNVATELSSLILEQNVGSVLLHRPSVISALIPEIIDMIGFEQNNPHHHLDVWRHTVMAIENAPANAALRLTMLLHDIAKPQCYTEDEKGGHFYGHPQVGSEIAKEILLRLGFDNGIIETVAQLVLYHDADIQPRRKHLKRWLNKIGEERLRQLLEVKRADAMAQSETYRQQKLLVLDSIPPIIDDIIEQQKSFSTKDLAVNGRDLMTAGVPQGIEIGIILNRLMNMVVDGLLENDKQKLLSIAKELNN